MVRGSRLKKKKKSEMMTDPGLARWTGKHQVYWESSLQQFSRGQTTMPWKSNCLFLEKAVPSFPFLTRLSRGSRKTEAFPP